LAARFGFPRLDKLMQALIAAKAYARIQDRLAPFASRVDLVILDEDDIPRRADGSAIAEAEIAPELFWVSREQFGSPMLGVFLKRLLAANHPRWVQVFSAGIDHPTFKAIIAKGARLTKSSAQAAPIAEYVLAHALSLLHPIAAQAEAQRAKSWTPVPFREIASTHWLIIGAGAIGREIAARAGAFNARLTMVRRHPGAGEARLGDLPALLPDADVVVLACALNDETRGLADARFFAAMKPDAILINIARGALVDEDTLREGLARRQPGVAVLDVCATEPLPAQSWIWEHPQIRVSAHTSNAGDRTGERGDDLFLANLARFLDGQALLNEASPAEVGL
jgi:phosphoglycerate dehydrogenase-like enzyme